MRNYLLVLLCVAAFVSCKKETVYIPSPPPTDKAPLVVESDTTHNAPVATPTLTISSDTSNIQHIVQGSKNSPLLDVTTAVVGVTMKGSAGTLHTLPVHALTTKSSALGNTNAVITTLRLYNSNGKLLDNEIVTGGIYPGVLFKNFSLTMPAGTTTHLTIRADVVAIDGTVIPNGIGVQVNVTGEDVSNIKASDAKGNAITGTNLIGLVTGPGVYIYTGGIKVTSIGHTTISYSAPGGSQTHGILTMTIPFSVTAFDATGYIPDTAASVTAGNVNRPIASAGPYVQYAIDNGSSLLSGGTARIVYAGRKNIKADRNGNYRIPVGQTKDFNLVMTYVIPVAGSYRAQLVSVNSNITDSGTQYIAYSDDVQTNQFRTNYFSGQ